MSKPQTNQPPPPNPVNPTACVKPGEVHSWFSLGFGCICFQLTARSFDAVCGLGDPGSGFCRRPGEYVKYSGANEFSHFGIHVRNLERALEFYVDRLGLEVLTAFVEDGEPSREVIGYPEAVLDLAMLRLPGTRAIMEVIELQNVSGTPIDPAQANPGTCHMAFCVDDLDTTWAKLEAFGSELVSTRVVDLPDGPLEGGKAIYLKDPDGIRVELLQTQISLADAVVAAGSASA